METAGNTAQMPLVINTGGGNNNPIKLLVILGLIGGAIWQGKKAWDNYLKNKENAKVGNDTNANLASKIWAELDSNVVIDSRIIDFAKQIQDYTAVNDSFKVLSLGKDMLTVIKPKVSSSNYAEILNIIGYKNGAVVPTSKTAKAVTVAPNVAKYIVSKSEVRIRKSPKKLGRSITDPLAHRNIITVAPVDSVLGYLDAAALQANGGKLFFDAENNIFFIPIRVFDKSTIQRTYPAFVAASEVNSFEVLPKKPMLRISKSEFDYSATNGVNGLVSEPITQIALSLL